MHLLIDFLAFVDVGAVVGERRFDLRVAELHERAVPQLASVTSSCASAAISSALICRSSPLTFRNAGEHVAGSPGRHLQLGRVLEDFRHDAIDELVVDLDAALLCGFSNTLSTNVAFASLPASSRANATIGVFRS